MNFIAELPIIFFTMKQKKSKEYRTLGLETKI